MKRTRLSTRADALATATLFVVVGAAMVGAVWWTSLPPDEWVALAERNPGWAVADGTHPLVAVELRSGTRFFLPAEALGANTLEMGDCSAPPLALPAWFRLPAAFPGHEPRCLRVRGGGRDAWVVNLRVGLDVPAVFESHFERLIGDAQGYSGGWGGRQGSNGEPDPEEDAAASAAAAATTRNEAPGSLLRSGSWSVDAPADGSVAEARVEAFRFPGYTELVAAFRRPDPAAAAPPPR